MRLTFLIPILMTLTVTACIHQKSEAPLPQNEISLPKPHQNFLGKWSTKGLTLYIKSDSIVIWDNYRKIKAIEVPSQFTTEIKVIKNNEFEYEIYQERKNRVTLKHHITYDKENNNLKYADKIFSKEED